MEAAGELLRSRPPEGKTGVWVKPEPDRQHYQTIVEKNTDIGIMFFPDLEGRVGAHPPPEVDLSGGRGRQGPFLGSVLNLEKIWALCIQKRGRGYPFQGCPKASSSRPPFDIKYQEVRIRMGLLAEKVE